MIKILAIHLTFELSGRSTHFLNAVDNALAMAGLVGRRHAATK